MPARASERVQARRRRDLEHAGAALGMARRDDGQQTGETLAQTAVRVDDHGFFARMRRGGRDHRALAHGRAHHGELAGIDRWRRHVELEIAGHGQTRRAEFAIALGVIVRLREAEIEARQQRADRRRRVAPAREGALRQAAVDQYQRNALFRRRHDQVRPQVGLRQEREVRPPMIEEAFREGRRVERHELMDRTRRQTLFGEPRRCHGARRHQDTEIALAQTLDQWDHGEHLADARTMRPDQRPRRTGDLRLAAPLRDALRVLLAAFEAIGEHHRGDRRRRGGEPTVGAQRPWQPFSHGGHLHASIGQSSAPAPSRYSTHFPTTAPQAGVATSAPSGLRKPSPLTTAHGAVADL